MPENNQAGGFPAISRRFSVSGTAGNLRKTQQAGGFATVESGVGKYGSCQRIKPEAFQPIDTVLVKGGLEWRKRGADARL